jgi:hypothetical protein
MTDQVEDILKQLVNAISRMDQVGTIGLSGGKQSFSPGSDLDLFIYCSAIPDRSERQAVLHSIRELVQDTAIGVLEGGPWGHADRTALAGVETWLMYFDVDLARQELEAVLQGKMPERQEGGYYPIGRCATLKNMLSLYDPHGWLEEFKRCLATYPAELAERLCAYHLKQLADREDLERAVQREDVLFYHFALDIALDHFLQALFALNREYFPSRKRSLLYIDEFDYTPEDCKARLLRTVESGGKSSSLVDSYTGWKDLVTELNRLVEKAHHELE